MPDVGPPPRGAHRALDLALLAVPFVWLCWVGWRRWADLYVDFGQQLYVPWRLTEGEILYRDIAYPHGPLSPYLNSLAFRLFGASYGTLIGVNLALILVVIGLSYDTFRKISGRLAAVAVPMLFVLVFAFGQYVGIGNYNWVSPYAHSATHGVALFILMAWVLTGSFPSNGRWGVAGLVLGALVLTRAETALAALAAFCVYIAVRARSERVGTPLAWAAGGAALPLLAAVGLFATALPLAEAVRAAGGAWLPLLTSDAAVTPFFLRGAGLDDPALAIEVTVGAALGDAFVIGLATAAGWAWSREGTHPALLRGITAVAFVVTVAAAATTFPTGVGRSLPILAWIPLAVWAREAWRDEARRPEAAVLLLWAVFALAMLVKTGLNARIHHYGFYVTFPAAAVLTVFLISDLPGRVGARGGNGLALRVTMVTMIAVLAVRFAAEARRHYALKTFAVGSGADRIVTYPFSIDGRVRPFVAAVDFLGALPEGATVQVVPEGVMLNYLTRRPTPSPYTNFMVTEVFAFGETRMLQDLERARPDYFVVMHKNTGEFGYGFFGSDERYGRSIMTWVHEAYERVFLAGAEPLRSPAFGIEILARRDR